MKKQPLYPEDTTRRSFVKRGAVGTTVALAVSSSTASAEDNGHTDVWVLHGIDNRKLMQKAMNIIQENGWFGKDAKTLALKVNAAWTRTPEEGANTHPDLVDVFIEGAKKGGIKKILIPEHPCNNAKMAFDRCGIASVAKAHKCKMIDLKTKQKSFREVQIPAGKKLKSAEVASEFLDADAVVNMPVAKHHSGATLTMGMKNWMGAIKDRRYWHRTDLHQCIADFSTFMKPSWTIIDATRCMMDSGPQGPAKELKIPNLLIVSKDQVAADAYASSIFHDSPYEIKYLKYAEEMGIGTVDQAKMNIHKIEVA
jgi:uncharacterized protein (DUF362 family)